MQRLLIATVVVGGLVSTAAQADVQFQFEGKTWTAVGTNIPISANHMFPGVHKACPSLKVKLEKVEPTRNNGGKFTRDQKNRGDTRSHLVCVRE